MAGRPEVPCFKSLISQGNLDYDSICSDGVCDGMPVSRRHVLEALNVFFTVIFIFEISLKLFSVGIVTFAGSFENSFDSIVIFVNLVEICASYRIQSGVSALRFFRVLRVSRLLRTLRLWGTLISAFQRVAPLLWSIAIILCLFIFASAQAGSEILGGKLHVSAINATCLSCQVGGISCYTADCQRGKIWRINFDSYLPYAGGYGGFVAVVALITRERWSDMLKISSYAGIGWTADLYLIVVYILGRHFVLNLILIVFVATYIEVADDVAAVQHCGAPSGIISELSTSGAKSGSIAIRLIFGSLRIMFDKTLLILGLLKKSIRSQLGPLNDYIGSLSIPRKVSALLRFIPSTISLIYQRHQRSNAVRDVPNMTAVLPSEPDQVRPQSLSRAAWNCFSPSLTIGQLVGGSVTFYKNVGKNHLFVICGLYCQKLQLSLAAVVTRDAFKKFIFLSCMANGIFILAEDPFALRTECCPQGFKMITNSTFFKGDRFCYRGTQDFLACSGSGICKSDGNCLCETSPIHYTGGQCQCRWYSSFLCSRQNTLVRHSNLYLFFRALDYLFVAILTFEAISKMLCFGLLLRSDVALQTQTCAYLQDPFQIWQGFVVILSVCALTWYNPGRESVRTLRLLLAFPQILAFVTPIHLVTQFITLFYKIAARWCSCFSMLLVVTLLFSIMSLQQFSGRLHNCLSPAVYPLLPMTSTDNQNLTNVLQCINNGGIWEAPRFNFDSIFDSVLLMLLIATDGWVDVMDLGVDATNVGKSPVYMRSPWTSFYFSIYILIAKALFLNVFLGVIGHGFEIMEPTRLFFAMNTLEERGAKVEPNLDYNGADITGEVDGSAQNCLAAHSASENNVPPACGTALIASEVQSNAILIGTASSLSCQPSGETLPFDSDTPPSALAACNHHSDCEESKMLKPVYVGVRAEWAKKACGRIRENLSYLMSSWVLDYLINLLVLLNFILMSFNRFPLSRYSMTNIVDVFFSTIYFAENFLKLVAFGPNRHFASKWVCFDSALTLIIFTFALTRISIGSQGSLQGVPELSMLRIVRFFRFCLSQNSPSSMQRACHAVTRSLQVLSKLFMVALSIWLSFLALGMGAFYNVRWSNIRYSFVDVNANFQNFLNGILVLLPVSSGDGWIKYMSSTSYDYKDYSCYDDLDLDGRFENESGCGGKAVSVLYFVSFYILNNLVFWNIMTAAIVFNFVAKKDNEIVSKEEKRRVLQRLVQTYARLDPFQNGFIETRKLRDLICYSFIARHESSKFRATVQFVFEILPRLQIKVVFSNDSNARSTITRYASVASVIYSCMKVAFPSSPLPNSSEVLHELVSVYKSELKGIPDLLKKEATPEILDLNNDAARVLQFGLVAYLSKLRRFDDIRTLYSSNQAIGARLRMGLLQRTIRHKPAGFKRCDSDPWGCMRITLVAAKNLQGKNELRKCDPFAVITCCGVAERSATLVNTNDPIWEQQFAFDCHDRSSTVDIEIFDDHKLQPEIVGRILIPISSVCLAPCLRMQQWFPLPLVNGVPVEEQSFVFLEMEVKMYKWVLDIQILGCRKLPEHLLEEKTELNSYVSLIVENQKFYTRPVLDSANPKFPERFRAFVSDLNEELRIVVLNNQPSKVDDDTFLAQLKFNVSYLLKSENLCSDFFSGKPLPGSWKSSMWYALQGGDGRNPWAQATVAVIEARDLPKMDIFGKVDCYCVVRLVEEDGIIKRGQRTSIQHSTFHPVWNQEFIYDLMDRNSKILLELFDHNLDGINRFIGTACIDLSQFQNQQGPVDTWHEIAAVEGKSPPVNGSLGSVRVSLTMQTKGADYFGSFGYIGVQSSGRPIDEVPLISDFCVDSARHSTNLVQNHIHKSPSDILDHGLRIAVIEGLVGGNSGDAFDLKKLYFCTIALPRLNFETKKASITSKALNPRWCEEFWAEKIESGTHLEFHFFSFLPPILEEDNFVLDNDCVDNQKQLPQLLGKLRLPIADLWKTFQQDQSSFMHKQKVNAHGEKFEWKCDKWFELSECEHKTSLRLIFSFEMLSKWDQHSDIDAVQSRDVIRKILHNKQIKEEKRNQKRLLAVSRASRARTGMAKLWNNGWFWPLFGFYAVEKVTSNIRPPGSKDTFHCRPVKALQIAGIAVEKLLDATTSERGPQIQELDPIRFLEFTGRSNRADSKQVVLSRPNSMDRSQDIVYSENASPNNCLKYDPPRQFLACKDGPVRRESELQTSLENSISGEH